MEWVDKLDYADLTYNPPMTPDQLYRLESEGVKSLGFDKVLFALTDHNEIKGCREVEKLVGQDETQQIFGEELSFRYTDHTFHLGVLGRPLFTNAELHTQLQALTSLEKVGALFELLSLSKCLVILNHPLLPVNGIGNSRAPVTELLHRYGWAIHALEFNGMRCREENDEVLELAKYMNMPVVGGGDGHSFVFSHVLSVSREAEDFDDFIEEVKAGEGTPLVKSSYFVPLGWKIFLRVMRFIADYRTTAKYRGFPIEEVLKRENIALDWLGTVARIVLRLSTATGLAF